MTITHRPHETSPCLTNAEREDYRKGNLSEEEQDKLDCHLEGCEPCLNAFAADKARKTARWQQASPALSGGPIGWAEEVDITAFAEREGLFVDEALAAQRVETEGVEAEGVGAGGDDAVLWAASPDRRMRYRVQSQADNLNVKVSVTHGSEKSVRVTINGIQVGTEHPLEAASEGPGSWASFGVQATAIAEVAVDIGRNAGRFEPRWLLRIELVKPGLTLVL